MGRVRHAPEPRLVAAEVPPDPAEPRTATAVTVAAKVPSGPSGRPVPPTHTSALVEVPEVAAVAPSLVVPEVAPVLAEASFDRDVHVVTASTAVAATPGPWRPVPAAAA